MLRSTCLSFEFLSAISFFRLNFFLHIGYFPETEMQTLPLTLDKVLDFGLLGPETKVRGGRRPPRNLVSSFDPPLIWYTPLNFGQNWT